MCLGTGRLLATVAQTCLTLLFCFLPSTKVPTSSSWTFLESLKEQHKVGAGQAGGRQVGALSLSVEMGRAVMEMTFGSPDLVLLLSRQN